MRVEKGTVRAPEIGRVWLNSPPLSFRQLRGRVVLVDFWDYTCVNCIRTLPRGIREFGLTYPIVVDSNREIWKAFANRYWPTKYLLDKDGYLRYGHFGEGGYGECEQAIQELIHEIDPERALPKIMEPLREEDHPGAVCYRPSGELYLGHQRGRIGNEGGFKEDQIAAYEFSGKAEENFFYANGSWASTAEYFEAAGEGPHSLKLKYEASAVNLVMAAPRGVPAEVQVLLDGKPIPRSQGTKDTRFRESGESYVGVDSARMYALADNHDFGEHELELLCSTGVAAFAFTFTGCVDPVASALHVNTAANL